MARAVHPTISFSQPPHHLFLSHTHNHAIASSCARQHLLVSCQSRPPHPSISLGSACLPYLISILANFSTSARRQSPKIGSISYLGFRRTGLTLLSLLSLHSFIHDTLGSPCPQGYITCRPATSSYSYNIFYDRSREVNRLVARRVGGKMWIPAHIPVHLGVWLHLTSVAVAPKLNALKIANAAVQSQCRRTRLQRPRTGQPPRNWGRLGSLMTVRAEPRSLLTVYHNHDSLSLARTNSSTSTIRSPSTDCYSGPRRFVVSQHDRGARGSGKHHRGSRASRQGRLSLSRILLYGQERQGRHRAPATTYRQLKDNR